MFALVACFPFDDVSGLGVSENDGQQFKRHRLRCTERVVDFADVDCAIGTCPMGGRGPSSQTVRARRVVSASAKRGDNRN